MSASPVPNGAPEPDEPTALDVQRRRDEGLGAAMIAHALMHDNAAVELLAREHPDPAALAAAVAKAAYGVLSLTALRPDQSNLFELQEAYGYAQWLAWDGAED
jgi:hypothetical protein